MRKSRMIGFVLVMLVVLVPGIVIGQNHDLMMERLENEIAATNEVLVRAREVVNQSNDEAAQTMLKAAEQRQSWAEDQVEELRRQFGQRLHGMALNATGKAREQARNAIAAVRRTDQNEGSLQRRMERARDLLEQARSAMTKEDGHRAMKELLEAARNNLLRARDFFNQGKYRPALKLTNQVIRAAERMLRATREQDRGWDDFERRHDGLGQTLAEARSKISDCDWLIPQLEKAEAARLKAGQLADEGKLEAAMKQLRMANELAHKAARECGGQADLEQKRDRLREQYGLLAEAGGQLSGEQARTFEAMLHQAREQLALTDRHLDQNQNEAARISLQAARAALNHARRILEGR